MPIRLRALQVVEVCTQPPLAGTPATTYVGISTLDRNVNEWLTQGNGENQLGAYVVSESTNKGFVVTRNADPDANIATLVEGMVVSDTTLNCLRL